MCLGENVTVLSRCACACRSKQGMLHGIQGAILALFKGFKVS